MSNAVGCFQLGNLAHDIVQGVVQLFVAVQHAVAVHVEGARAGCSTWGTAAKAWYCAEARAHTSRMWKAWTSRCKPDVVPMS